MFYDNFSDGGYPSEAGALCHYENVNLEHRIVNCTFDGNTSADATYWHGTCLTKYGINIGNLNGYNLIMWNSGTKTGEVAWQQGDPTPNDSIWYYNILDDSVTYGIVLSNGYHYDPSFTDAGSGDFTLQAGSAMIDSGMDVSGTVTDTFDLAGNPPGAIEDLGCLRYVAPVPPAEIGVFLKGCLMKGVYLK